MIIVYDRWYSVYLEQPYKGQIYAVFQYEYSSSKSKVQARVHTEVKLGRSDVWSMLTE